MGMFFYEEPNRFPDRRPQGFRRYRQVLERNWKSFLFVNFLTLLCLLPFGIGVTFSILYSSVLILIPSCILGGILAGVGIAGMYDRILRGLRANRDDWWYCYKKAARQNFRTAVVPGILQCLFLGFYIFACYMLWVSGQAISGGTLAILAASALLSLMIFGIWWPQVVLFDQRPGIQLKNCILFCIHFFWRCLGVAALKLIWWLIFVLLLPWTAFLVPFIGVWYLWFLCTHLIYDQLDNAFSIEKQILETFPEQVPDYAGE